MYASRLLIERRRRAICALLGCRLHRWRHAPNMARKGRRSRASRSRASWFPRLPCDDRSRPSRRRRRQRPADRRAGEALRDRGGGAARRLVGDRARGAVRAAGAERGGEVDADPLHDRAGAADRRHDLGLRPRRDRQLRGRAAGGRPGAAGGQPRLVPHRRGDARLPRRLFRHAQARAARAHQGAARDLLADREGRRTHPHPLRGDEAAADPGAGDDAPAAPADPRRADRRRRRRVAAGALALRAADQPGGDDDPAHHPLHRGGRAALRSDRLHRRGADRRRGQQRRAGRALRRRQPRGRLPGAGRPQGAFALPHRGRGMSAAQIRFTTLWRREVNRFMKIKKQTIGAPLLETFLYITVFGAALGSRIKHLHGIDYVLFVIPGLIMMAFSTNAFSNNSSSILQQKFQGPIQDQLSSPASPAELLLAFSLGGFMRGLIVATLTFIAASILVALPVEHILVLIPSLFLVGFFFAQLGVLIGVRAEQFDDVAFAQTFILTPLIFLGGVFYSAALLDEPFQTLTH